MRSVKKTFFQAMKACLDIEKFDVSVQEPDAEFPRASDRAYLAGPQGGNVGFDKLLSKFATSDVLLQSTAGGNG